MVYRGDLEALAKGWIEHHRHVDTGSDDTRDRNEFFWAWEELHELVRREPDTAWAVLLDILNRDCSPPVMANLAAGPMEDLLAHHGPEFIDRVERQARQDVKFRSMLGGVWQNAMSDDIWRRVEAVRGRPW